MIYFLSQIFATHPFPPVIHKLRICGTIDVRLVFAVGVGEGKPWSEHNLCRQIFRFGAPCIVVLIIVIVAEDDEYKCLPIFIILLFLSTPLCFRN